METTYDYILNRLKDKGINLSHQRLKVLEYLYNSKNHPTVEHIYTSLLEDIPTLSKTTIYNTLKILEKAGMVKGIPVKGKEICYDIYIKPHGHFLCRDCRSIFDFDIDMDSLTTKGLEDFKISDRSVYFKGICPGCLS